MQGCCISMIWFITTSTHCWIIQAKNVPRYKHCLYSQLSLGSVSWRLLHRSWEVGNVRKRQCVAWCSVNVQLKKQFPSLRSTPRVSAMPLTRRCWIDVERSPSQSSEVVNGPKPPSNLPIDSLQHVNEWAGFEAGAWVDQAGPAGRGRVI